MGFRKQTISNAQENIVYTDQEWWSQNNCSSNLVHFFQNWSSVAWMHLAADVIERKFFPVCCKQQHVHVAAFHAFSSMYASFNAQSRAMCQSYMQIGYSDAPDIVINYRKSKGHVISTIYCTTLPSRFHTYYGSSNCNLHPTVWLFWKKRW